MHIFANKWSISITLLVTAILPALPTQVSANTTVKAITASFPITINGTVMDTEHSMYPFLFYKDITYLPLTWNNFQALGLRYQWNELEGLQIDLSHNDRPPNQLTATQQDLTSKRNSGSYAVQVSNEPIKMVSTLIDNWAEPYPFLTYQDVTYMPLTWHFVHDLLHLDIHYSDEEGLSLIGGQLMFQSIIRDDASALYLSTTNSSAPNKVILKMDNSYQLEWKSYDEIDKLFELSKTPSLPYSGKPVQLQRSGRNLLYNDIKLLTLTDSDVMGNDWAAPVQTYSVFQAGDNAIIISINLTLLVPHIGPNYGSTHNFLIRNGKATELEYFNQKIDRVIPNPDGTVWISSDRLPIHHNYIPGSALLGLLDPEGQVHMVNAEFHQSDVMTLGIRNPAVLNPAAKDGSLYVLFTGISDVNDKEQDTAGLYRLNTKLQLERLSDQLYGDYYLDSQRNIYIQHANNTIENFTTGEIRNWYDYELAQLK